MRVDVEPDSCITAGVCVAMAPSHFDQDDDDGTVIVLKHTVDASDEDAVRQAVEACPVRAIALAEESAP